MVSQYIKNLEVCIDQKLRDYCLENGKSIVSIDQKYLIHSQDIAKIYRIPEEHYSKILAMAYRKTIKQPTKGLRQIIRKVIK